MPPKTARPGPTTLRHLGPRLAPSNAPDAQDLRSCPKETQDLRPSSLAWISRREPAGIDIALATFLLEDGSAYRYEGGTRVCCSSAKLDRVPWGTHEVSHNRRYHAPRTGPGGADHGGQAPSTFRAPTRRAVDANLRGWWLQSPREGRIEKRRIAEELRFTKRDRSLRSGPPRSLQISHLTQRAGIQQPLKPGWREGR